MNGVGVCYAWARMCLRLWYVTVPLFTVLTACVQIWIWILYVPDAIGPVIRNEAADGIDVLTPGQPLRIRWTYCVYRSVPVILHRSIEDGIVYHLVDVTTVAMPGCYTRVSQIEIPPSLPPGRYAYRVTFEYRANPLRVRLIRAPDISFVLADRRGSLPPESQHSGETF